MGRGDKRTKKGKRTIASFGKARPARPKSKSANKPAATEEKA